MISMGNGEMGGQYLDLDTVELLAIVDTDDRTDHLGDDDHVAEVGLDTTRAFHGLGIALGLTQALDEGHGLALEAAGEAAAGAGVHQVHEFLVAQVQELVEVHATVRELLEGALLADGSELDVSFLGNFRLQRRIRGRGERSVSGITMLGNETEIMTGAESLNLRGRGLSYW
jgi:hypothetical protein